MLVLYVVVLLWLVLFKLKVHIFSVFHHHYRSLNLIPFAAPSMVHGEIGYGEMVYNCLFFIPFGLLLNVNFKQIKFLPKLAFILVFSISVEVVQYIFAIGATDITDVIMNTLGGFIGLKLYSVCNKLISSERLDGIIISLGAVLLVLAMLARSRITLR